VNPKSLQLTGATTLDRKSGEAERLSELSRDRAVHLSRLKLRILQFPVPLDGCPMFEPA
jgi:hypothetical protein